MVLDILDREDGLVRMTVGADVVKKEFRHVDAVERVSNLVKIYKLLKQKKVPNVDVLQHSNLNALQHSTPESRHPYVLLSPVGRDVSPKSGLEAFQSIVCVLQALKVHYGVSIFII